MPSRRRTITQAEPGGSPSLAHTLRDELERMILDADLRPGDRLPSENELILSVTLDEPTATERAALGLSAGHTVIRLERLRRHDDDAVVYSVDIFNRAIFDQPISEIDWTGSLFALFERAGHRVSAATATVSAVHLDAALAERLSMPADIAWLLLTQEHSDSDGKPILLSRDYHRELISPFKSTGNAKTEGCTTPLQAVVAFRRTLRCIER